MLSFLFKKQCVKKMLLKGLSKWIRFDFVFWYPDNSIVGSELNFFVTEDVNADDVIVDVLLRK